jgi:hypothetical protein
VESVVLNGRQRIKLTNGEFSVELKTQGGKKVNAYIIACILPAGVTRLNGTLVEVKTGKEVLLEIQRKKSLRK